LGRERIGREFRKEHQCHRLIRERRTPDLDAWIDTAARGLLASFANGLSRDRAAVAAALAEPWSNGQTEGQITA
jgi:transposase